MPRSGLACGGEELTKVTESALPAFRTDALKRFHSINAGASVPAGLPHAVVNVCEWNQIG